MEELIFGLADTHLFFNDLEVLCEFQPRRLRRSACEIEFLYQNFYNNNNNNNKLISLRLLRHSLTVSCLLHTLLILLRHAYFNAHFLYLGQLPHHSWLY